ncbi:MAG TPA: HAD-IA family hydrolase [Rubrivivax sp.]|nr:HAD-IA family hydrolase [Rubrivivax sp.]
MTSTSRTKPRRFDLIVFDWDGTLFDSTMLIVRCIQAGCRDIGVPAPSDKDAAYVIGLGLHDALQHAVPGLPPARYPELGQAYRQRYWASQHELVLFPGTLPMLQELKERQHLLAVATGKNRRGLNDALAHAQLNGMFDGSRTADETAGKPNPLMLKELMAEFDVKPERTLMIGDTTHDLMMAVNAGTPCVGVSYGAHHYDTFAQHQPLFVAHSTTELHAWLTANA